MGSFGFWVLVIFSMVTGKVQKFNMNDGSRRESILIILKHDINNIKIMPVVTFVSFDFLVRLRLFLTTPGPNTGPLPD